MLLVSSGTFALVDPLIHHLPNIFCMAVCQAALVFVWVYIGLLIGAGRLLCCLPSQPRLQRLGVVCLLLRMQVWRGQQPDLPQVWL